jgi:hypothetical protein
VRTDTNYKNFISFLVKFLVQENKRPLKVNVKMEMRTTGDLDAGIGARKMVWN